jgi:hypothetical protein
LLIGAIAAKGILINSGSGLWMINKNAITSQSWRCIASLLLLLFIYGCTATTAVISPEYRGKRIRDVTLAIELREKEPTIDFRDSVALELGMGEAKLAIMNFFKKQLAEDIKDQTGFSSITYDSRIKNPNQNREMLDTRDGQIFVDFPVNGTQLSFGNSKPDFVLIIDNLSISATFAAGVASPVMTQSGVEVGGGENKPSKGILYKSTFVLWDNRAKKLVSYGYDAATTAEYVAALTRNEWLWVTEVYASKIFLGTPFRK